MHSLIIVSTDKNQREGYALNWCKEKKIDALDILFLDKDKKEDKKKTTLSLGIEDIKEMQPKLFLKPLKSSSKAVIIIDAHLVTNEAQNALLKVLEEPPKDTFLLLVADSIHSLLPTILSRCQLITLETVTNLTDQDKKEMEQILAILKSGTVSERMVKAEMLSKVKEESLTSIEKFSHYLREELLLQINKQPKTELSNLYIRLLRRIRAVHTMLKTTNINPRFALENFFLTNY